MTNKIHSRLGKIAEFMRGMRADAFIVLNEEGSNWESLYYFSGFRGSCGALAIYPESAELILDGRYIQQGRAQSPLRVLEMQNDLAEDIKARLKKHGARIIFCEAKKTPFWLWCNAMPDTAHPMAADEIAMGIRRAKDEEEIAAIKQAAKIASRAFLNTLDSVREGMKEKEFEALLNYNINMLGGETGFDMIVASGVRSAMPHGRATDKEIKRGEIVTVDFGARYDGYFCDITRNFVIGSADSRARELHDILLETHRAAAEALRSGIIGTDVHILAEEMLARHGLDKYFTHGLGHGFGLEIHEYALLSRRRNFMLREKDTLTIEPGVYIEGWGGLRLEDDYRVTDSGCERLTNMLEQKLYEI